ncbi:MAG: MmcQ/YjbR family DNA-binding protein [Christensenellaceae bacterium]
MLQKEDIIAYCMQFPMVYEDHPFHDATTVFRHTGNHKSFVFLIFSHGRLHVNLKCNPARSDLLRQSFEGVIAGYHMNKTHWNSVFLDSDVPDAEILKLIDHSFLLTRPTIKKQKIQPHYVYILLCRDGSLYTGWTTDLQHRLHAHQEGKGAKYTKSRLPVKLVYHETFEDKSSALKREYQIKQLTKAQKHALIKASKSADF